MTEERALKSTSIDLMSFSRLCILNKIYGLLQAKFYIPELIQDFFFLMIMVISISITIFSYIDASPFLITHKKFMNACAHS